jgi:3-methylcrotonyl-CoA carboxylase alpha subunit
VRIDSGVRQGDVISPFYDPMIAKVIVWGKDRHAALANMRKALAATRVAGVVTNLHFLGRLLDNPDFSGASLDTGLIERWRDALLAPRPEPLVADLALLAARILEDERANADADPWSGLAGFRLNASSRRTLVFDIEGTEHEVVLIQGRGNLNLEYKDESAPFATRNDGNHYWVTLGPHTVSGEVDRTANALIARRADLAITARLVDPLAHAGASEAEAGRLTAPMPGKVVALLVDVGQKVARGEPLLVMEAMKMEHTIAAPADGTVRELLYGVGDQVNDGAQLLVLDVETKK